MEIHDRLEGHWYESKIDRNLRCPKAATVEKVATFEEKNAVTLVADLRESFPAPQWHLGGFRSLLLLAPPKTETL
jgi:cell wall assembly regulator SMI1